LKTFYNVLSEELKITGEQLKLVYFCLDGSKEQMEFIGAADVGTEKL